MGRRSEYSRELAETICARMVGGLSVREISRHKDMPSHTAIYSWIAKYPEFRSLYADCLELRGCGAGEAALACRAEYDGVIADVRAGRLSPRRAQVIINAIRAKVDVLKWSAGRMAPKFFGLGVAEPEAPALPPIRDEPQVGNVIPLEDAVGASRVYRRIVAAGGRR